MLTSMADAYEIVDLAEMLLPAPRLHRHCGDGHHGVCMEWYGGARCSCHCHRDDLPASKDFAAAALRERRSPGETR